MKKLFLFIILQMQGAGLFAQQDAGELWKIWKDKEKPDSVRLAALDDMAWNIRNKNPDSAIMLASLELEFAEAKDMKVWEANACNMLGIAYYIKSNYARAIEWHKKCFAIWEAMGDKPGMASSYNNLGNIYSDQGKLTESLMNYEKGLALEETKSNPLTGTYHVNIGTIYLSWGNYPKALEEFQLGLAAYEKENNKQGVGMTYTNIGVVYDDMNNSEKALEYYGKSLSINREIGDKKGLADAYLNIGIIKRKQGHYKEALDYQQRSIDLDREIGNGQAIAGAYGMIAEIYEAQGYLEKALEFFEKDRAMSEELGIRNQVAYSYINMGGIYFKQKKYALADSWVKKGLQGSEDLGLVAFQRDANKLLYEINKAQGKGNLALAYHEKFIVLNDSLQASETNKKLDQMEFGKLMLADSLKKDKEKVQVEMVHEKEVHQKNQQRNLAIYGGIAILVLAAGLWSRLRYVRKSRNAIQKEKNRSENLLLNILPAEIAEELKANGRAEARDFELVSILFTDFKEFTSLSEKMSAKDLVAEINYCFEAFDRIAGKYKIEKIKTIGDSYMAAGGLPLPAADSIRNTVMAALEMQAFIRTYKTHQDLKGLPAFQMRVGIHTGPVVAGIVGVKKFQYDIWGDTVNTASRMESNGEVGEVNISQTTYELIKDEPGFRFLDRGKIRAKGKGEIGMYFVQWDEAGVDNIPGSKN